MAYDDSKVTLMEQSIAGPSSWRYQTSDSSTDCTATGYFKGAGYGSNSTSYKPHGLRLNDAVTIQMTSGSTDPGRTLVTSVIGSSADQGSTISATGYAAGYNVSLKST